MEDFLLPAKRGCRILGLKPKRFYRWRKDYTFFGIDGLVDEKSIAKIIPNKLLKEEEEPFLVMSGFIPKREASRDPV